MRSTKVKLVLCILSVLICSITTFAQRGTSLRGQVTDQLSAVVVGATVTITDANGKKTSIQTDSNGGYRFDNLRSGAYNVSIQQKGFAPQTVSGLQISPGVNTHDFQLSVTIEEQRVTVDDIRGVSTDPNSNKTARVLSGSDLNSLSDDPNELAAQLDALAGPAAGPNGTQVFVDGFTAANGLPDKQTIQQIVINQNPFSAEFERIGFGTIQVFTKPGTGKFHGGSAFTFSDAAFNSRNPFAANKPPYQRRNVEGNLSGPITKRASFFFNFGRRDIDDTAVIAATTLDSSLNPQPVNLAVVTPKAFMNLGPRFDFALNKNNTLSVRYNLNMQDLHKQGVGGFALQSRAFDYSDRLHILQAVDMAIVNPRTVNEFGFQYIWYYIKQQQSDASPAVIVNDAFTGGGAQIGGYSFKRHEGELRDYLSITTRTHTLKFGARLRWAHIGDTAPSNFGGTFIFTSLDRYRQTLLHMSTPNQLIIAGGNPFAEVKQWDIGPFFQDDWKMRPDFTLSLGLRYQYQTQLNSKFMFAPRLSFAWTPFLNPKGQPKTVIRGGAGLFYDLVRTSVTLQANRYNGTTEQQYVVTDPALLALYPNLPTLATISSAQPQTIWKKVSDLTEPYYLQTSISVEHTLPHNTTLSVSYIDTHGLHQLRSRNLNAPAPVSGIRPSGNGVNIYDYETTGWYKQHLLMFTMQSRLNRKVSFNANYSFGKAEGDTDGAGSFPSNSYDLRNEFGRSSLDVRHRFNFQGSFETKWGIGFFPLVIAQSGAPFNITTGLDNNGDSLFIDRPAFATDLTRASVRRTPFGNFDLLPLPGAQIVPRNYGNGPSYFSVNFRIAKTFGFGSVAAPPARRQSAAQGKGGPPANGGQTAAAQPTRPAAPARPEDKPYRLTLSLFVANVFNHTNLGTPIGNLSSSLFGTSNSISGLGQFSFGAGAAQSNRSVTLRAQFQF
ncbi:MAG TPA: carboxypeptidase regulatory-like domain-containing protein [Pyrinomonadaceae bacterium]|nr:carboxypeptidase regulatory-like domain-containing protein [Pyrinomonadaceae bacterium]